MDRRSGTARRSEEINLQPEQSGRLSIDSPIESFEKSFIGLLNQDLQAAKRLLPLIRRRINQGEPSLIKGRLQRLIGRYYEASSHHRKAIQWTKAALTSFKSNRYLVGVLQCLRMLFTAHAHLGHYKIARGFATEALAMDNLAVEERLKIQMNLGAMEYRHGDYGHAQKHFQLALSLLAESPAVRLEAITRYNLANVLLSLNRFGEAETHYQAALDMFDREGLVLYQAHVLQAFGHLFTILGQYYHAERRLQQAKSLYLDCGDQLGSVLCEIEMLRMMHRLNRNGAILEKVPELVAEFRAAGRVSETAQVYFLGGKAAFSREENELAEAYFARAGQLFKQENHPSYTAHCTLAEGLILLQQNRRRAGLNRISAARKTFVTERLSEPLLECLIHECRTIGCVRSQDFKEISRLLKKPIGPFIRSQALLLISDYWYGRRQWLRSIRVLFEAVNTIEETRATIVSQTGRLKFFENKAELYDTLIRRLFDWRGSGSSELIFKVFELSRSRSMSEYLCRREALPPVVNRETPSLLALQQCDLRLVQLNRKLESLADDHEAMIHQKRALLREISDTKKDMEQIRTDMRHEGRLGQFLPFELGVTDLQNLLEEKQLVVILEVTEATLYRIEIGKTSLRTYQHSLDPQFFEDLRQLRNMLGLPIDFPIEKLQVYAERLSRIILPTHLDNVDHLAFVAHQNLHGLPLAMMRYQGRYLIETHTLNQAPNLPVLYFTLQKPRVRLERPVFFFSDQQGDPQASERAVLATRFPTGRSFSVFTDPTIGQAVAESDFIHFAGHCHVDARSPNRSYLRFGSVRVRLRRLARINFRKRPFVNLAACRSGWMAWAPGHELHGFVAVAFSAGASQVLAALWDIDDQATGEWMTEFYHHLELGPARAYQAACRCMIKKFMHPRLWAGFLLLGRP